MARVPANGEAASGKLPLGLVYHISGKNKGCKTRIDPCRLGFDFR